MPKRPAREAGATLLLVADHDELRRHIARLLRDRISQLRLSEAVDRREALQLANLRTFQVIIVDIDLAHDNAIRLAVELQRLNLKAQVILLSRLGDEGLTANDLPLKGAVIVPRQSIGAGLPDVVERALAGRDLAS